VQHCDIKPQNMLLVGNVVQVCDFGLARVQGQVRATANNLLSIAYAAPEMMVKPFNPSPTTDQYSLAVSYYELRTGRLPYGDQPESSSEEISAVELMRAKTDGMVELGLVPPIEQRVLMRGLALDPTDRFGSCEELVDMLESAVQMDHVPQRPPVPFPWLKAVGLAGGGLLVTAFLAWMLMRPDRNPIPPPTEYLPQAEAALVEAAAGEGIDQALVERAAELAAEARAGGEDLDACSAIEVAAQAVLRALPAIPAIRDNGTEIVGLGEAEAAVGELPDSVPKPLRVVLENDLGKRKQDVRAGLARKIIDRAVARLNDNDLRSPETPIEGKKRSLEDSVQDLEQAIEFDPGSWLAHDRLGLCESLRGRYPEAIEAYGKALGLMAEQGGLDGGVREEVLRRRAYALAQARRYGEAAADYVTAADHDAKVCGVLWELKNRAWETENYADAAVILDHLERLLRDDPECCPAEINPWDVSGDRAWLLACGFGDDPADRAVPVAKAYVESLGKALETAEEGGKIDLMKRRFNAVDTLACAYARAGDFAAAMRTIDELLAQFPSDNDFQEHREKFERQEAWDEP
jgi:tetratricopeptide (TPR) repeat protein